MLEFREGGRVMDFKTPGVFTGLNDPLWWRIWATSNSRWLHTVCHFLDFLDKHRWHLWQVMNLKTWLKWLKHVKETIFVQSLSWHSECAVLTDRLNFSCMSVSQLSSFGRENNTNPDNNTKIKCGPAHGGMQRWEHLTGTSSVTSVPHGPQIILPLWRN